MLNSYELIGFISPALGQRILNDTAVDNRELYRATLTGVAQLRGLRPQFIKRQPQPARHSLLLDSLKRPAFEESARRPIHCSIGPITSQTLRENDLSVDLEAPESTLEAVVEALGKRLLEESS